MGRRGGEPGERSALTQAPPRHGRAHTKAVAGGTPPQQDQTAPAVLGECKTTLHSADAGTRARHRAASTTTTAASHHELRTSSGHDERQRPRRGRARCARREQGRGARHGRGDAGMRARRRAASHLHDGHGHDEAASKETRPRPWCTTQTGLRCTTRMQTGATARTRQQQPAAAAPGPQQPRRRTPRPRWPSLCTAAAGENDSAGRTRARARATARTTGHVSAPQAHRSARRACARGRRCGQICGAQRGAWARCGVASHYHDGCQLRRAEGQQQRGRLLHTHLSPR